MLSCVRKTIEKTTNGAAWVLDSRLARSSVLAAWNAGGATGLTFALGFVLDFSGPIAYVPAALAFALTLGGEVTKATIQQNVAGRDAKVKKIAEAARESAIDPVAAEQLLAHPENKTTAFLRKSSSALTWFNAGVAGAATLGAGALSFLLLRNVFAPDELPALDNPGGSMEWVNWLGFAISPAFAVAAARFTYKNEDGFDESLDQQRFSHLDELAGLVLSDACKWDTAMRPEEKLNIQKAALDWLILRAGHQNKPAAETIAAMRHSRKSSSSDESTALVSSAEKGDAPRVTLYGRFFSRPALISQQSLIAQPGWQPMIKLA